MSEEGIPGHPRLWRFLPESANLAISHSGPVPYLSDLDIITFRNTLAATVKKADYCFPPNALPAAAKQGRMETSKNMNYHG